MTEHQASRAEHQGKPAHNCPHYRNARGELIDPAQQGGIGCKTCYPPDGRITSRAEALRAAGCTCDESGACSICQGWFRDGMARLEHDVVTLPPDQVALGLVEALIEEAGEPMATSMEGMRYRMGVIQGTAERLAVLLAERDAAAGDTAAELKTWQDCFAGYFGPEGRLIEIADKAVQDLQAELRMAEQDKVAALARVKDGS